ncbi:hypothetical protein EON80_07860, partial [bacterium]
MSFFWKRARALAQLGCAASLLGLLGQAANAQQVTTTGGNLTGAARATFEAQFKAFQAEKAALTPAQRKLSTPLALAIPAKRARVSANLRAFRGFAAASADGRSDVTITAPVTPDLLEAITKLRGTVVSAIEGGNSVRALLSPLAAEQLAARADVRYIKLYQAPIANVGPNNSEGDTAHAAGISRELFKVSGKGMKIGVLSDGIRSLATSQANGELPAKVTVVRDGKGRPQNGPGDEGTAMLEIVHDLAPEAQLFFATAFVSKESFADNIKRLRAAGCDIIVDDVIYLDEGVYQDDIVAQAVTEVVNDGALYFSSAGNQGNLTSNTSGTWDGQFRSGGTISTTRGVAQLHSWNGEDSNVVTRGSAATAILQWADPLGAATSDYDLYVVAADGEIVGASQDVQTDTGAPFEVADCYTGEQIVVTLLSGQARPLHLQLFTGTLAQATVGSCYGHAASEKAIGVAAVSAITASGRAFNSKDVVERFSSDGYRTYYFDAAGKKKTYTVKSPQIAAADGVTTSVPGFTSFYGTSAAAPHAAAIAALIWSNDRKQSPEEVKNILYSTAIDIMGSGFDRNAGNGLIMVDRAFAKIGPPVMSLTAEAIRANEGNTGVKTIK